MDKVIADNGNPHQIEEKPGKVEKEDDDKEDDDEEEDIDAILQDEKRVLKAQAEVNVDQI